MATELETLQEELLEVKVALKDIREGAQSVSIGDMSYTQASYKALGEHEKALKKEIARLNNTRMRVLPVNFGGIQR